MPTINLSFLVGLITKKEDEQPMAVLDIKC